MDSSGIGGLCDEDRDRDERWHCMDGYEIKGFLDDSAPMRDRILQHIWYLRETAYWDEGQDRLVLVDGEPLHIPACAANLIARHFNGEVLGYWSYRNPDALLHEDGGYNFCLIERRWLVDFNSGPDGEMIYDLVEPGQRARAHELFGAPSNWERPRASPAP